MSVRFIVGLIVSMMQFFEFIQNHWYLASMLAVFLLAYLIFELRMHFSGAKRVNPQQAIQLINRENPIILDIRDKTAFEKGHIIHARHVKQAEIEAYLKKQNQSNEAPIMLVCQSGAQTPTVGARLKKQGYTQVHQLAGGMNAWQAGELPIEKG